MKNIHWREGKWPVNCTLCFTGLYRGFLYLYFFGIRVITWRWIPRQFEIQWGFWPRYILSRIKGR